MSLRINFFWGDLLMQNLMFFLKEGWQFILLDLSVEFVKKNYFEENYKVVLFFLWKWCDFNDVLLILHHNYSI